MSATATELRPVPQIVADEVDKPRTTKRWVDWVTTTDHKKIGIMYLGWRWSSSASGASKRS